MEAMERRAAIRIAASLIAGAGSAVVAERCADADADADAQGAPSVPLRFDAREPFARPMIEVVAFGRRQAMLVDTGSHLHVLGARAAQSAGVERQPPELFAHDFAGHPIVGFMAAAAAAR